MSEAPTVGIIGLGIGRAHIRGFQANGCKITAVCQRDEAGGRRIAERYGIPGVFTRWQDLIEKARPAIVVIASPPNLHREIALAAFAAGAHVLCEKPLAMNQDEGRAMVEAAAKHKKVAMTCFNWRYPIAMQEMSRRLAQGAIGRVLHVNARWYGAAWANPDTKATWRMDAQQAGFGAMGDMGVHLVDLIRSNLGAIARVSAATGVAYPQRSAPGINRPADADDHCSVLAELESGALVTLNVSRVTHGTNEHAFEVFGDKGALCYRLVRSAQRWYEGELRAAEGGAALAPVSLPPLDTKFAEGDPMEQVGGTLMAALIARLLDGIKTGKSPSPTLEEGLQAQLVLDAIAASVAQRGWAEVKR
jgi:predicted dehydrogenase